MSVKPNRPTSPDGYDESNAARVCEYPNLKDLALVSVFVEPPVAPLATTSLRVGFEDHLASIGERSSSIF